MKRMISMVAAMLLPGVIFAASPAHQKVGDNWDPGQSCYAQTNGASQNNGKFCYCWADNAFKDPRTKLLNLRGIFLGLDIPPKGIAGHSLTDFCKNNYAGNAAFCIQDLGYVCGISDPNKVLHTGDYNCEKSWQNIGCDLNDR